MTHQKPWLESTVVMCNKTELVSIVLKMGLMRVAGDSELRLLMVCRQACDTSTSC